MKDISEKNGEKQKMCVELWFDFAAPGMNSKDGHIRGHWSNKKKTRDKIQWAIIEQGFSRILGKVKVTYKRTSSQLMDWDNLASSSKYFMDVLQSMNIIEDDSPNTIPSCPNYQQEKGKKSTYIKIEQI